MYNLKIKKLPTNLPYYFFQSRKWNKVIYFSRLKALIFLNFGQIQLNAVSLKFTNALSLTHGGSSMLNLY